MSSIKFLQDDEDVLLLAHCLIQVALLANSISRETLKPEKASPEFISLSLIAIFSLVS